MNHIELYHHFPYEAMLIDEYMQVNYTENVIDVIRKLVPYRKLSAWASYGIDIDLEIKERDLRKFARIQYAIYKQNSKKDRYVTVIINENPFQSSRSSLLKIHEVISERKLTEIEIQRELYVCGTKNRMMEFWYYESIEDLIDDDNSCNAITPERFVKYAISLGHSRKQQTLFPKYA